MRSSLFAIAALTSVISGCSTVGHEAENCAGSTSGISCASSREVFEITNYYNNADDYVKETGDSRVTVLDKDGKKIPYSEFHNEEEKEKQMTSNSLPNSTMAPPVQQQMNAMQANAQFQSLPAVEPVGMRKAAEIVRVLTRPYVDSHDRAQVPGYSYVEAVDRTWIIDREAKGNAVQFQSVGMRKDSLRQDYTPNDNGEIGVSKRSGNDITIEQAKANARKNANEVMFDIQNGQ
ncbi:TraV family lipoprotein (plasmid) [Vibrio sp. SS-MA-C1-2]|uniref:TraV family lipoprotein n=1 Tax=Vibrio sp. SS-MA-C1-2 TaxID=2908646 RepID=UPI001F47BCD5|nr:TraV family lipoprotein [Vibrio sp. SS-MA-C1-2]UJF20339.1 TraV family lipoprotein [Vibrio sp. SS-MA-C1-2]